MAISARELVFYIRAEDQASRVVKRAARNIGSMANIKSLQAQIDANALKNVAKIQAAREAVTAASVAGARKVGAAEQAIADKQISNAKRIANAQQALRRNLTAVDKAQRGLAAIPPTVRGYGPKGFLQTLQNPKYAEAAEQLATLNRQTEILQKNLADVERSSTAASAALSKNLSGGTGTSRRNCSCP